MENTESYTNSLGQPIGFPVPEWKPVPLPPHTVMEGRLCTLEPLSLERHADSLFEANSQDPEGGMWTYMPVGPFANKAGYFQWVEGASQSWDPLFFAIIDKELGRAVGVSSYLRIDPNMGCIEVGHLAFSPLLQKKPTATEAMYLMMERAFALGYRRYEWKCNALNAPSRRAAQRLGFSFEGVFRQALIVKGHNRDTAWYSILDREWSPLQSAFLTWLDPANFDEQGVQRQRLSDLTSPLLHQKG